MGALELHLQRLVERVPAASSTPLAGVGTLITVPALALPAGWNKAVSAIYFVAPNGYPYAKLDCFWADHDLRLASGQIPKAANLTTPIPVLNQPALWFSWHTDHWNAARDDLASWVASIRERLAKAA